MPTEKKSHRPPPTRDRTELPVIPARGAESVILTTFLDHQRAVVRRKAEGLIDEQLRRRLPGHPSPLTIGGVVKHLGWVEIKWSQHVFAGCPYDQIDEPWRSQRGTDSDWEWDPSQDSAVQLLEWFETAVATAGAVYSRAPSLSANSRQVGCADPGSETLPDAESYELRWILTHLIEEYARHAGHLDLIREEIDGVTGS